MVVGLDGIERVVETVNPETNKPDRYVCCGYYNTGRFVPNWEDPSKPDRFVAGELVDWYRPLSGAGEYHSFKFLQLMSMMSHAPLKIYVKGEPGYE